MRVKNSAIIYTGYDYQTLQGVKLLAEWIHSPTRYLRVAFEADRDENEAPEGIDDIVCERPDGVKDFWQVKFTPSPEKHENGLTWDWLLKISGKTAKSRSILKKLFDAIAAVPDEKLGDVVLLTNKRPDRVMESCLCEENINFTHIDTDTQSKIIHQLGSSEAAKLFFSRLTIQHSDLDYLATNRSVRAELLKFSDHAGVERLIARSREWAMFKNNPPSNGWIHLNHVREVLSPKRPEPIPEIFSVPKDYSLPNTEFHNGLLNNITNSSGGVITLTGKPGAGKSTYLSYLCQSLELQDIPLVRHHYFLSLGDSTDDRLSPRVVAESLLYQINSFHTEVKTDTSRPENLREALRSCSDYYKTKGKVFVVLIDGLDHVWRDNAKNKKPLDETFRQLLPATDNLVILVGTQPVDDELLPGILLTHSPKRNWHWLPEMSGNSIYEFLKRHVESGRLFMNCHDDHVDEEIQKSARILLDNTNGYPLHLIYSVEFLSQNGLTLSSYQVERLPPCSDGNITTYYSELWRNLTYRQQDVLHLCSGFQFAWPRQAIGTVVKDEHDYAPSVDAVAHMLSEGISGSRPFHESLVVFVQNQEDHQQRINTLLPCVCDWLSSKAPLHLKDNWLWSSQARAGDSSELRLGVTRDWVLDKLVIGMPVKSCIRLLSEAETYAFKELKYAEAFRHRELKTRLFNGPEFQTWDSTSLGILSLVNADEPSLNEIISGQNEYSPIKLAILAIVLWSTGKSEQAKLLSMSAIDRYRSKTKLLSLQHSQNDEAEVTALIKAGVLTDSLNYDVIFENEIFSDWSEGCIASFRNACLIKKDLGLLLRAWDCLPAEAPQMFQVELDAIRLSIVEDADITCRPEYEHFSSQKLSCFVDLYSKHKFSSITAYDFVSTSLSQFKVKASSDYYEWFFSSLCIRLNAEGDYSWLPVSASSKQVDTSNHYHLLNELSDWISRELIAGNSLKFDFVCSIFPSAPLLDEIQSESRRSDITLKRKWIEIAADCHLITTKSEIERDELKHTIDSGLYRVDWLRLWYKDIGLKLLSDDAVELLIESDSNRQINELENTIENSNAYLELSQIAFSHDKTELYEECLKKTWDFVLGYGHHKDPMIFDVLKAVDYLSATNPDSALTVLERISPIIFNISEFTDGDGTRHSTSSLSSLVARLNPQTAASMYEKNLIDGEWPHAEEAIFSLLQRCSLSLPIVKNLYLTGLDSASHQKLREQIEYGDATAIQISNEIECLLGINVQRVPEDKHSKTEELDNKITLQPSNYPPEKYQELVAALKGEYSTRKFWESWYQHWVEQDKELELLQLFIPQILTLTDRLDDKRYLLDLLFLSQRKLNGKAQAFKLLVAAHNAMNGWSDWYESSENSISRLKIVAEQYPKKIDEFIKLTTSEPASWKSKFGDLIIPNDKLVFLLSQSGRSEEALQLTYKMVESLEESVRNLKLTKPTWDWQRDDSIEEALTKCLVARLKLPIPSIKLWVIEQISCLLVEKYSRIEDLLKQDLANRKQESECVEVLCVFLVAKSKGYICPNNLGQYVNARSTLSDLILNELITNPQDFGKDAYVLTPFAVLDGDNHRFEYYQGSHVPFLYHSWLKKEEKRTGLAFTDQYRSEWNNTFEYIPSSATTIDYFMGGDRQRTTGQFYTQASHRGRSAYLRTIENAKQFFGMPDSYAAHLSIPALPIEPAYIGLVPRKPTWIPEWESEILPERDNLIRFVKDIFFSFTTANESHDLLALSMPIKLDNDCWIDLTMVKATTDFEETTNIEIQERMGCLAVASLLEPELSYEFDVKKQSESSVLAVTSFPFMRYGHWHSELECRGLYVPKCNIDGKTLIGSSNDGLFYYSIGDTKIGFSSYWYNDWLPAHPKGIRSLCGSYTAVQKNNYANWLLVSTKKKYFYSCKVTVLSSKDTFREHEIEELTFTVDSSS
jgi:hypothetical protein